MAFAIKEINGNPNILPNITLGFHILNSYYVARMTYKATLSFLSSQHKFLPNFQCDKQNNQIAIIGGQNSKMSVNIATISTIYNIPQLAYGSLSPAHGSQLLVSSVYQMVPNEATQYMGVIKLFLYFRWTWIVLFVAGDDSGDRFLQIIMPMLSENGICFDFSIRIPKQNYFQDEVDVLLKQEEYFTLLTQTKANVHFVYGENSSMFNLRLLLLLLSFISFPPLHKRYGEYIDSFSGPGEISKHPSESDPHSVLHLTNLQATQVSTIMTQKVGSYMVQQSKLAKGPINYRAMGLYLLNIFLRSITFNTTAGDTIQFNENGELKVGFDVTNWVTFPNGSFIRVKVGRFDPWAPPGEQLTIHDDQIVWHRTFNQERAVSPSIQWSWKATKISADISNNTVLPLSVCNDHCLPGYSRKKKEGKKFCCYDCVLCSDGMISEQIDMDSCVLCPHDKFSNYNKNQCLPKDIKFLSYEEPIGIIVATLAISFSLVTAIIFGTFLKHQDTPIVKANNRSLTYLLLTSLAHCFLSALLFIGQPGKVTCLLRQTSFAIIFSVAISSVLAKTITVVLAFVATKPGSRLRPLVGKKQAYSLVLTCSLVQVGICVLWISTSSPFPDKDLHSLKETIILECNEGSAAMFFCVLGYMGFLAAVSFMVAFLARRTMDIPRRSKVIYQAYIPYDHRTAITCDLAHAIKKTLFVMQQFDCPNCFLRSNHSDVT
ncbi:vomeronasal type-2 receptor 26-like [Paroedura picta]|uniref:vomeronasal type-2 receptor 26-like n=1 Tax=Paroedura picta TaxID=143630 RepID=UPI004055C8EA